MRPCKCSAYFRRQLTEKEIEINNNHNEDKLAKGQAIGSNGYLNSGTLEPPDWFLHDDAYVANLLKLIYFAPN